MAVLALLAMLAFGCAKKDHALDGQLDQGQRALTAEPGGGIPLPYARHAEPWPDAPIVEVKGGSLTVDDIPAGHLADAARDASGLAIVLKEKRMLWEQLNPGSPFPGDVIVAAPRGLRGSSLANLARGCASAGFPRLLVSVHDVSKPATGAGVLGVVQVTDRDPDVVPGATLRLTEGGAARIVWNVTQSGDPASIAMAETLSADGTLRFAGLAAAISAAGDRGSSLRAPMYLDRVDGLSLEQIVGIADTLRDYGIKLSITRHGSDGL